MGPGLAAWGLQMVLGLAGNRMDLGLVVWGHQTCSGSVGNQMDLGLAVKVHQMDFGFGSVAMVRRMDFGSGSVVSRMDLDLAEKVHRMDFGSGFAGYRTDPGFVVGHRTDSVAANFVVVVAGNRMDSVEFGLVE